MKRKSLLFLLLFALIAPWTANAQTTVTIGEGTATSNTNPIGTYYNYSITEQLYTADEVFSGTLSVTTTAGWVTINLDTPFAYDGTSNLLIGFNKDYLYYFSGQSWQCTNVTNMARYSQNDYNAYDLTTVPSNVSSYRPNIQMEITAGSGPTCARPTNFVVSYTGGSTATVTWEGEASLYNIDINGTVTEGVTSPYVMNVLPATAYTVKVQADCGDGLTSGWTGAQSFFTPCEAFDLPYAYGFEDANELNCWNMVYTANTPGIYNGLAYEGDNSFRFSSYSSASSYDQYLISPELNTTNGVGVAFSYAGYTYGTETFKVGYSTTTNDPSAFTWGDEISVTGSTWQSFEENYPVGTKFVGIYYYSNYQYYLYVDGFSFDTPSNCFKPTNFVATEVGNHSAKLSWVENGEARAWNLKVNGEILPDEIDENPYILSGLAASTTYTVQVSPVCEVEKWSDEISFTTEIGCAAPTALSVAPMPESATITWNGSADAYEMEYAILGEGGAGGTYTYAFEEDLEGWTNIIVNEDQGQWLHSSVNTGGYDYTELAHSGTGFAVCYSYTDYVGSYNTDAYLVSPMMYQLNEGASLSLWYDMANSSYPEYFEVCVATAASPTAEDFTAIWTLNDAKAMSNPSTTVMRNGNMRNGNVRHRNNARYDNWAEINIDLSAYVGQSVWIALHDVNEDAYEVWIDDITVNAGTAADITWIPIEGTVTSPYTLEGLEPGTTYMVRVHGDCGEDGESAWTTTMFPTPTYCDVPTGPNATNVLATTATLNWNGYQDGFEVRYRTTGSSTTTIEGFSDDFESGTLDNWTTIRGNEGTEYTDWRIFTGTFSSSTIPPHSGSYLAMSRSWSSSAYHVCNWLISPQVTLDGELSYWVMDDGQYHEHYDIYVSTTTADTTAFTLLYEPGDATEEWTQHTVDLSSFNGQQGYIAFRHNDYDQDWLFIDDVVIGTTTTVEIPAGEWEYTSTDALYADIEGLEPETEYEWQVRGENRDCGDEGFTEWSALSTFTTHGLCDNPTALAWEADGTTVTLSWTGYQDSFDLTYYTAADGEILLETGIGFSGYSDWTPVTADTDTISSFYYLSDDYSYIGYGFSSTSTPQYLISPEFDAIEGNGFVEFMYYASGTDEDEDFPETFKIGYSTTDAEVESFTFGDTYTVSGINYIDIDLPEGAKYFAIKYESDHAAEATMLFVLDFAVVSNYVPAGEPTTLTGVTSPQTITGLDENAIYRWEVTGICGEESTTETIYSYFLTEEQTTVTQTLELTEGWNWVSLYVEFEDAEQALLALEEALGEHGLKISAMDDYTTYEDDEWGAMGDLEELTNDQMYMVLVDEDIEVEIEGMPSNPADYTITILADNWTWIGFPSAEALAIEVAFADFEAEDGDKIQGVEDYSKYEDGEWGAMGDLEELTPGQGYMYFYNGTEDQDLVISTGAKRSSSKMHYINREKKANKVFSGFQKVSVK